MQKNFFCHTQGLLNIHISGIRTVGTLNKMHKVYLSRLAHDGLLMDRMVFIKLITTYINLSSIKSTDVKDIILYYLIIYN